MHVDKDLIAGAIGPDRYERGRQIAWALACSAGNTLGRTESQLRDASELYDIVDNVLGAAFEGLTDGDRMRAACALYDDFPSYTILSQLFTFIGRDALSRGEMVFFYGFLGAMLSAAAAELAQPASYMLWVEFFEDQNTVDEAWNAVCAGILSDDGWQRLLRSSGPVPERLKIPVLERFIGDPSFHEAIFDALSVGVFDIFGRMSRETVESILPRLRVDPSHAAYAHLLERLADPAPITFEWQLDDSSDRDGA